MEEHRTLAEGTWLAVTAGVRSVRQLWLKGFGMVNENQEYERRHFPRFHSPERPPSKEITVATTQAEERPKQGRKQSLKRFHQLSRLLLCWSQSLPLSPGSKDMILALLSTGHLEAGNLATDDKNSLLPGQELRRSGSKAAG